MDITIALTRYIEVYELVEKYEDCNKKIVQENN